MDVWIVEWICEVLMCTRLLQFTMELNKSDFLVISVERLGKHPTQYTRSTPCTVAASRKILTKSCASCNRQHVMPVSLHLITNYPLLNTLQQVFNNNVCWAFRNIFLCSSNLLKCFLVFEHCITTQILNADRLLLSPILYGNTLITILSDANLTLFMPRQ